MSNPSSLRWVKRGFSIVVLAAVAVTGCSRHYSSHYQVPPKASSSASANDTSMRFLDALVITDRVAQFYYFKPESCVASPEVVDCRHYTGYLEACVIKCWQRPATFTISMQQGGLLDLKVEHGESGFKSTASKELEEALVSRLEKQFGEVRVVAVEDKK